MSLNYSTKALHWLNTINLNKITFYEVFAICPNCKGFYCRDFLLDFTTAAYELGLFKFKVFFLVYFILCNTTRFL